MNIVPSSMRASAYQLLRAQQHDAERGLVLAAAAIEDASRRVALAVADHDMLKARVERLRASIAEADAAHKAQHRSTAASGHPSFIAGQPA